MNNDESTDTNRPLRDFIGAAFIGYFCTGIAIKAGQVLRARLITNKKTLPDGIIDIREA